MKTIIEPFRIKSVEPLRLTTEEERKGLLRNAHYNLFGLSSDDVLIDLLTDSGTSAMSAKQWAAIMLGDESYAGSPSFRRFEQAVRHLMPFRHIIPTHQGRAAEAILFHLIGGPGRKIPSNTHFDTTRGNIEATGAEAIDLPAPEGLDPAAPHPFKGNIDLTRLEAFLRENGDAVPCVMITVTNNAGGGQPASLANIRKAAELAHRFGKRFIVDGCRFAENAWFIKQREPGQHGRPVVDIVRDMFALADGMTMSAKKDAFANIGGWLALNDDDLAERARTRLIRPRASRPTAASPDATSRPSRRALSRSSTRTISLTARAPTLMLGRGSARWACRSCSRLAGMRFLSMRGPGFRISRRWNTRVRRLPAPFMKWAAFAPAKSAP